MDKVTGQECMLLFTDPLTQTTPEGEMAILGMPFFREYEISFDFCTKEMYTKRSKGDCHRVVGQHPSNVQYCADRDWFSCWMKGWTDFFKGFFDGLVSIFKPAEPKAAAPKHKKSKNDKGKKGHDDKSKGDKPSMFIKPESLRLSSAATWLLETSGKGGMVSI